MRVLAGKAACVLSENRSFLILHLCLQKKKIVHKTSFGLIPNLFLKAMLKFDRSLYPKLK